MQDACYFCSILTTLQSSKQIFIFWNYPKQNFMKLRAAGVSCCTDRCDRQTDVTKLLTVIFHNFLNAPKMHWNVLSATGIEF